MKNQIKKLVLGILKGLARVRIKRLRLFVIGVTGSIGKTSVKDAIYTVLNTRYKVYRSEKSYNTDFGLPLAILEQKSGFSSPLRWIKVLLGSFWNAYVGGRHMQMLVVEMGVDKPGDMVTLLKLVQPQVGVLTNIKPVHIDEGQFKDMDDIFEEKSKLILALPEKGVAVLNADDPYVIALKDKLQCKTIFYGKAEWADLRVVKCENENMGIKFTLKYGEELADGELNILGDFQIYTVLAAVATALTQGFTLQESVEALRKFALPPGRMNPIEGVNESLIIDSSYNASPESVREALNLLGDFEGRRIAVLGSMNELGSAGKEKHLEVGNYACGKSDMIITVGELAKHINTAAKKTGFNPKELFHFNTADEAGEYLKAQLRKGDIVLVKGSQNKIRLERLVKQIMKEPWRAVSLLVRQEDEWKKIQ